jgi:hypothetical protein
MTGMKPDISVSLAAIFAISGCATTTSGANPHDMSVAQHNAAAEQANQAALAHHEAYQPNANVVHERCSRSFSKGDTVEEGVCWESITNPTAIHEEQAKKMQKAAADHRAAAAALVAAEGKSCAGIAEADRDMSPFEHTQDITRVTLLNEPLISPKSGSAARTVGVVVAFRAVPGLTTEWFQHLINCHLARIAALGHVVPEMPNCPLVPKGVTAQVTSAGDGFAVAVRSDDPAVVQEIIGRAQRLVQPASAPEPGQLHSDAH